MKRWKKIALALLLLLILSQTPFVYRRFKLARLQRTIDELNARREAPDASDVYADYHGVVHVHSALGGHSKGTPEEIVRAAKMNGLAFVLITEHPSKHVNTFEATLKGIHEGVLFINGSEINTAGDDRLLVAPGIAPSSQPDAASNAQKTAHVAAEAKRNGRLVIVAYPEQFSDLGLADYDGLEVYNLFTNSKKINYAVLFFDGLWSYWSYPHLLFATFYERPAEQLRAWDELTLKGRKIVAVAGNDAHQNVGLSLEQQTGEPLVEIQLDPYERSFQVVRTHVLVERAETLDAETLVSALARGHTYIAFDLFGEASGFRFTAESGAGERRLMGDEIALVGEGVQLKIAVPVKSRVVVFRDGQLIDEARDVTRKELTVKQKGVYRVEVYLDQLGQPLSSQPWIISNPIYVR